MPAMSEIPHWEKIRIMAFFAGSTLARQDALSATIRDRCQLLTRDSYKLLAMTRLTLPAELVFARTVIDLGLPLVAVLPVPEEKLRQQSSPASWTEIEPILRAAVRVDVRHDSLMPPTPWQELIDEADVVLIFENESGPEEETGRFIKHSQWLGRETWVIRENQDSPGVNRVALESDQRLLEVSPLVRMLEKPPTDSPWPEEFLRYAEACSEKADRMAPVYRKYFLNVVLANAVAAMAGTVQLVFMPGKDGATWDWSPILLAWMTNILTGIKFGCVAAGAIIFVILQVRKSQIQWIDARLQAEMCRSARATWRFPRLTDALALALQPAARETLQFLRYVRAVHPPTGTASLEELKADYGINRLEDQFHYYKGKADSASALSGRLKPFYWIFTALSILAAIVSLLYPYLFDRHRHQPPPAGSASYFVLNFLPIMAPAFASWILAWDAIETLGRQKARYREMQTTLHLALADLVQAETPEAIFDLAERTERKLLGEVQEWYSFIKFSK